MNNIDFVDLLLTYQGRINRAKYWLAALIYFVFWIGVGIVAWIVSLVSYILAAIIVVVALLVTIYAGVMVGIKRLHDRDKSGWYLLLFYFGPTVLDILGSRLGGIGFIFSLAGFAIAVWAIVELGCLRGTAGPNQYGPDPLESRLVTA